MWKNLNDRVGQPVPRDAAALEAAILAHRQFEDELQQMDVDVSALNELFRQLPDPTPTQRSKMDQLNNRWADIWELSRMYVQR